MTDIEKFEKAFKDAGLEVNISHREIDGFQCFMATTVKRYNSPEGVSTASVGCSFSKEFERHPKDWYIKSMVQSLSEHIEGAEEAA